MSFFPFFLILIGIVIGYYICRRQYRAKNKIILPVETFNYLVERDNELWEIERAERSKIRFIAPVLKAGANSLEVDDISISLN